MDTSPGHGRANEDFVGAVPGVVVLLDGAGIPNTEGLCRHGTAWHSHTLGAKLLARLAPVGELDLVAALAVSIEEVAGQHRDTCDITHVSSPQSTVAIIRFVGDRVDHLVLGDTFVVLDLKGASPRVITDPREIEIRDECMAPLRTLVEGTTEHARALASARSTMQARRNQPGGYWIAKDDPRAAVEAVTGTVPLAALDGVALMSNGASRLVDPYRLANWPSVMQVLRASGPHALLHRIRAAEAAQTLPGFESADDATIAFMEMGDP